MAGGRTVEDHRVVVQGTAGLVPDLAEHGEVVEAGERLHQPADGAVAEHGVGQALAPGDQRAVLLDAGRGVEALDGQARGDLDGRVGERADAQHPREAIVEPSRGDQDLAASRGQGRAQQRGRRGSTDPAFAADDQEPAGPQIRDQIRDQIRTRARTQVWDRCPGLAAGGVRHRCGSLAQLRTQDQGGGPSQTPLRASVRALTGVLERGLLAGQPLGWGSVRAPEPTAG